MHGRLEGVTIMRPSKKALGISALALALAFLLFSSCGQTKEQENQEQQKQEQEKVIKALEEIETVNESIIQLLDGPVNPGKEESRDPQGRKQEDQQQGKEQQGKEQQGEGQEKGKEQQGKEQQQGEAQQGKQPGEEQQQDQQQGGEQQDQQQGKEARNQKPQDDIWDDVDKSIIELHSLFNEYIPAAAKLGASTELGANASNTLNQLTKKAEAKNQNEVLTEANNLFKAICDYYVLHQDKRAPAKILLFHARRVMLSAKVGDWQTAAAAMNDLEENWNGQKNTYGDKQKDTAAMLDLSVANLAGAVAEKNQNLTAIKGLSLSRTSPSWKKA